MEIKFGVDKMPLHDYMNVNDSSDIQERFFKHYSEVPDTFEEYGKTYKKMPSRPSRPRFNGSGFYETDYGVS
jgi:predicted nucleic acid-binding Zn ribbon protein